MMSAKVKDEALSPSPVIRGDTDGKKEPYVLLLEQPASKALRFRYICEGRSAGSLPGERTQGNYKTHPTIQVFGYKGPAVVVVSCVTKDPPYRPHPHNLVGREGCDKGVCTMYIDPNTMKCQFQNLGIQCVRKRDIAEALEQRQQIKVDPFQTGFDHKHQPNSIDLNALRLCFQVFIEGDQKNKFVVPLKPIVSEPIYDRKAVSDLSICKMSHCNDTVAGGREVIILCEKVAKENISVRFFEETPEGDLAWEDFGKFQPSDVHKQVAICLRTPRYRTLEVTDVVRCQIQLLRPSDKATSAPRPFEYFPLDPGTANSWLQKNSKASYESFRRILAADSGALLSSVRYASETAEKAHKACQTTLSIGVKPDADNWIELIDISNLAVDDRSPAVTEYLDTLTSVANEMKQDMQEITGDSVYNFEDVQNGNFVSAPGTSSAPDNGLSPPPIPPKRKKTQKTQTQGFLDADNGNSFPTEFPRGFLQTYDRVADVSEFDSDLHEKAALYAGSPPLATMSELDDLDALSIYAKIDELSGDSATWVTMGETSGMVTEQGSADNANNNAGLKLNSVTSSSFVDDPDYIPLPVLDLFV